MKHCCQPSTKRCGKPNATPRIATLLTVALLAGCGGGDQLETTPVAGTVTLDGRPLEKGIVIATPDAGRAARGIVQPDGSFTLSTYGDGDGAIVGTHRVTVTATESVAGGGDTSPDAMAMGQARSLVPTRYGDAATSGLQFEAAPEKTNQWTVELTSQP